MLEAESAAVAEIDAFKNPREGWFEKLGELADQPLDLAGGAAFESALGDKFESVVAKVVGSLNDFASWSVREQAISRNSRPLGVTSTKSKTSPRFRWTRFWKRWAGSRASTGHSAPQKEP